MADAPTPPQAPAAYYPALDGLRALAVVLVFLLHFIGRSIFGWGWIGVNLFFVLSGFLITGILYDSRSRAHAFRDFYMRRTLRIFPLYFAIWGVIFVTQPLLHWQWPAYGVLWPLYLGDLAVLSPSAVGRATDLFYPVLHGQPTVPLQVAHFWSLCVEEQFYLIWPCVVLLSGKLHSLVRFSVAVIAGAGILRFVLVAVTSPAWRASAPLLYINPFTRVDSLMWGALLALLLRMEVTWLHRHGRRLLAASTVLLVLFCALRMWASADPGSIYNDTNMLLGLPLMDVFSFALVLELIRKGSTLARWFSWSPARALGGISYGFYVFHFLFARYYSALTTRLLPAHLRFTPWATVAQAVLGFVCTLGIATLSYHLLERPFIRLKRRFPGQTHTAPTA